MALHVTGKNMASLVPANRRGRGVCCWGTYPPTLPETYTCIQPPHSPAMRCALKRGLIHTTPCDCGINDCTWFALGWNKNGISAQHCVHCILGRAPIHQRNIGTAATQGTQQEELQKTAAPCHCTLPRHPGTEAQCLHSPNSRTCQEHITFWRGWRQLGG